MAERAAKYDRENEFFHEDFAELRNSGYLTMAVLRELGGGGLNLLEVCQQTRRLPTTRRPRRLAPICTY
jgi:alkylation response protein AidB-like acyl-CoA dehydrogenase